MNRNQLLNKKVTFKDVLKTNLKVLKFVFKICPAYIIFSIFYILASTFEAVVEVHLISDVITLISNHAEFKVLLSNIGYHIIVIAACYIVITIYDSYIKSIYSYKYRKGIQEYLYRKVKLIDISCYDDPDFYDKFSRGLTDASMRGISTYEMFVNFVKSILTAIALGTYVVVGDYILLIIIVLSSITNVIMNNISIKLWHGVWHEASTDRRFYWYIRRVFYGQRYAAEIKTTPIRKLLISKYKEKVENVEKIYNKTYKKVVLPHVVSSFSTQLLQQAGSYLYLAYRLFKSFIDISAFTTLANATFKFANNFQNAMNIYTNLRENSLYSEDFLWILEYEPQTEKDDGVPIDKFETLEIKNISFAYPKNKFNSINNLSMTIKKGDKIAIVGDNGGGKTTLMKLLLRFYEPKEGAIIYNNQNLGVYDRKALRKNYSIIFQDFQIYAISVAENVLLRRCETKEDEEIVWHALQMVGLYDYVKELPDGIYTEVSKEFDKDGVNFSGGEKQRLAIARVFASNADIYILDEPTASLDPIAEERINKLILNNAGNKTMIIIAHRLSTVVDLDKIYLIRNGAIIESGTHEELLALNGVYNEMFSTQKKLYQKD